MLLREIVEILTRANLDPSIKDFKIADLAKDSHYTYTADNQNNNYDSEKERCI